MRPSYWARLVARARSGGVIGARWADAQANHLPPEVVAAADAPCKEVVFAAPELGDGDRFPHLVSTPG